MWPAGDQRVHRGVRGVYGAANSAVRGILVKVAFSCKMEQKGTEADQKGGGNQKQQGKAQKSDRSRDERDLTNHFISCVLQRIIRKVTCSYCHSR